MIVPLVAVTVLALYYLWSVIFASENAHLRAREYALHGARYLPDTDGVSGSAPFSGTNYERADSTSFTFWATAKDQSLGVFAAPDEIETTAIITSE